jgi:hypothetical protein
MIIKNRFFNTASVFLIVLGAMTSCKKLDRPALGDYEKDRVVVPTTPLRFFVNFDSTSAEDNQINIRFKDSISGYPSFFPDASLSYGPGVHGTALVGNGSKGLSYVNSNDFMKSTSFTVAFWEKHDGAPPSDAEFVMSVPSTQGHWSNAGMLLIFDHKGAGSTKDSAVIKLMVAEVGNGDHWFELTGKNRMANILDNQWHHLAFAYDQATSDMKIYRDGVLYSTQSWPGHGAMNLDYGKVTGFYLAGKTTDWGKPFNGMLDQFRLYNTALTDAEVQNLYQNKL